ncbi:MAG TPA: bifunctional phosphoribosylaminoimidazolecarboxamide formyltransferase/IMP cyclohydrolase, partial [Gaiellaceae bacterium]
MRALISVYDKSGVVDFARGLVELGFEIVSSGGTGVALAEAGIAVTKVEDVTGFPELLDGRVKTLHPRIHAGILVRRGRDDDAAALSEHGIEPFDLVCVNLYPFELAVDRPELDETALIEMIDVGGPALLRAAAKNFASVTVVVRARDYDTVLDELRASGATTPELRRRLAAIAFARSAAYEAAIARWFQQDAGFPETLVPAFDRVRELPYGENPHQRAAYYAERGARTHLLGSVRQHQGKDLSFNNLGDLSAARLLTGELDRPACVIVKHANPCGAAVAETIEEAYAKAVAADPVS